jgi:hypothetical protein
MPENSQHNVLSRVQAEVARYLIRYKQQIKCALRHTNGKALPIFIMGYGRSGTTVMLKTFALDDRFEIFSENDTRIARDYMLIYEKVNYEISTCKTEALVMKPILNSFDAAHILQTYETARIIWMIRDYRDVVASAVTRFGSTVADYLKELVTTGTGNNWLASGLPKETLGIIREMEATGFTDYDWMALIWWSVNRTILLERLYESRRFFLLRYEDLVLNVDPVLAKVHEFLKLKYKPELGKYIHEMSVRKGSYIQLRPVVEEMCDNLMEEIIASCNVTSKMENAELKD